MTGKKDGVSRAATAGAIVAACLAATGIWALLHKGCPAIKARALACGALFCFTNLDARVRVAGGERIQAQLPPPRQKGIDLTGFPEIHPQKNWSIL